jgi:hypothetical protein
VISTVGIWGGGQESGTFSGCRLSLFGFRRFGLVPSAQRYGLPLSQIIDSKALFGHAKAEDGKLRKDLTFGGPCFEGTLQKPTGVSESSPVAGTIKGFNPSKNLRCRTRTRVAEKRPASHTNALGELFIPEDGQRAQEGIDFFERKVTGMVPRLSRPEQDCWTR